MLKVNIFSSIIAQLFFSLSYLILSNHKNCYIDGHHRTKYNTKIKIYPLLKIKNENAPKRKSFQNNWSLLYILSLRVLQFNCNNFILKLFYFSHPLTKLIWDYMYFYLSNYLSIYLYSYLFIYIAIYMSNYLFFYYLFFFLSIFLSIYFSIYLFFYP